MTDKRAPRPSSENWSCGFEPVVGEWACMQPSTWHGFRLTDDGHEIASMMSCCDDHKDYMARNADYMHEMVHPCGLPGSRFVWPENYCYTDWDERELTGVGMVEATA